MQYRQRLRTRIILSFLLLGFGLTAMFALASMALRSRLEGQLLDNTLQKEVDQLVAQVRADPNQAVSFTIFDAHTWSTRRAYEMPLDLQSLGTGVHDIAQIDENGRSHLYKYAIRR